ncbi:hypothetical protein HB981_00770 [Listeria seeligeri]|uniref:hypothetical protein n=1 Tax=Listeria seeligeri TaxID=1640 RepID=UPI001627DA32|nr:hypothetical protein [Listeria seeligeri]MBC1725042.1 hypothetical protein [Listeria seeligeri]MBC1734890.1 hypothetical protein [Listeria seeligeri]MBF2366386.1 hypothetical protein [Listeria seeligeri]MBF2384885.1 hypothetical protein [Listeria seeligeri]MBF2538456.1 hypothetical protein [Listeria seeligeri]
MNNNSFKKLITKEFHIMKDEKSLISIAPLSIDHYPENFAKVSLDKQSGNFDLISVYRKKEFKESSFSDEHKAMIALYVYGKRNFEFKEHDSNAENKIERANSIDELRTIFETSFGDELFSFFDMKVNRFILEKQENDRYNVLFFEEDYSKIYITKSRKLNIAAGVLYNYCVSLKRFYNLIEEMNLKEDVDFVKELEKIYLFKE